MKIDLGNYKYCEDSELEELGKIKNKILLKFHFKVNGTLFKTLSGTYVFYGRVYDMETGFDKIRGWNIIPKDEAREYLSLCDTINENNKWDLLGYEKV